MTLYLFPFVKSFLFSVFATLFLIWLYNKIPWKIKAKLKNRLGSRHIHSFKVSRFGGVAIISAFIFAILRDPNLFISQPLWGIILACGIILVVGIIDDFHELDWKTQLSFQFIIAVLVFIMGVRVDFITNPLGGYIFLNLGKYVIPSLIFVIIWIALIINSVNWLDGIDGLSGGVAFIAAMTIFFLSLKPEVNQPPMGIITMSLVGALLGFLIFNFYF